MPSDQDIEARIRKILEEQLEVKLAEDAGAVTMEAIPAWDSMAQVQVLVAIEREFGVEVDAELIGAQSLTALVEAIRGVLAESAAG